MIRGINDKIQDRDHHLQWDSTQSKTTTLSLQIIESIIYINEVQNDMADLVDITTNDPKSTEYIINFLRVNTKFVTKDFIKSSNVPDITSIPISLEDYIN